MKYAVTGAHFMEGSRWRQIVADTISDLRDVEQLATGAYGDVDVWALLCGIVFHPDALHIAVIPATSHSEIVREIIRTAPRASCVHLAHAGTRAEALRAHRAHLAGMAVDGLVAFPQNSRPQPRSETWATIGKAAQLGRRLLIVPLDGSPSKGDL